MEVVRVFLWLDRKPCERPLEETDAVRARQIYERASMPPDMYDFNLEEIGQVGH